MVMKKLFLALAVAVLLGACTCSPKEWDDVAWLHSTTSLIAIEHVEYTDTATILTIHEKHTPGQEIKISSSTRLIGNKGKEYKIVGGEGITIGEQFVTPEGGEAHFKLLFEPMPKRTHYFDYIESYSLHDWRIYGIHNPAQPIEIPRYKKHDTKYETAEGFLHTDTVYVRGKIENYSHDKGFTTIQINRINVLTREDLPISVNINEDGTFEVSYTSAHPKFELLTLKGKDSYNMTLIYTVPGCTTELIIDEDGNFEMTSPDEQVMTCKRIVDKDLLGYDLCNYMEREDSMAMLDLKSYIAFLNRKEAAYNKHMDYLAWRYNLTPTERHYLWLNEKVLFLEYLFDYDFRTRRSNNYTADSIALEYDSYQCLHDMPYNDGASLAIHEFIFAISRYECSRIILKDIFKPDLSGLDYVICHDTTRIANDMKVLGASAPTLWGSIMLLRDTKWQLEYLRDYKEEQPKFVEMHRELLTHPFLKAELDRLYAKELEAQKPSWTLPEGEATDILRRMTDKYRGKYLLIDFWGMGCGPCRAGIERSKEMRKAFRDHPEVDFLFISAPESSQEAYDAYVKEHLDGEDCHVVSRDEFNKLMQLFKFLGIPHYETLDPDGNVLNKGLEYSTTEAFTKQLEELREQL